MNAYHFFPPLRGLERIFGLTSSEREYFERIVSRTEEVEPRRKLIVQGKPCNRMFLVVSGWLTACKQLRDGRCQILNVHLPGDLIGTDCLVHKVALHSTAALTPCIVAPIPAAAFDQAQRDLPRLPAAFLSLTLREGAIRHEWMVNIGRRAGFARIAHLLLELDRRAHLRGLANEDRVPLPLTQEEIADCTGLTVSYVNRILQQMRKNGQIQLSGRALEILDRMALIKAADFRADYLEGWALGSSTAAPAAMALAG